MWVGCWLLHGDGDGTDLGFVIVAVGWSEAVVTNVDIGGGRVVGRATLQRLCGSRIITSVTVFIIGCQVESEILQLSLFILVNRHFHRGFDRSRRAVDDGNLVIDSVKRRRPSLLARVVISQVLSIPYTEVV